MKTGYPKRFNKWYEKNTPAFCEDKELIKSTVFEAWKAGLKMVANRIKLIDKSIEEFGGGWQHEDIDGIDELIEELTKETKTHES